MRIRKKTITFFKQCDIACNKHEEKNPQLQRVSIDNTESSHKCVFSTIKPFYQHFHTVGIERFRVELSNNIK